MKKIQALCATLFAATSLFAADILEIRPCDQYGNSTDWPQTQQEWDAKFKSPLGSGVDLYFNIRLVSREENGALSQTKRSKFDVVWNPLSGGSEAYDLINNPFQIGVVVGGADPKTGNRRTEYARLHDYHRTISDSSTSTPTLTKNLTDMIFVYHTKPGDFALPIKLASDQYGTPVGENDSGMTVYVPPAIKIKWNVYYYSKDGTVTNDAVFAFNPNPTQSGSLDISDSPDTDCLSANYSMRQCGFVVRTVDFADAASTYADGEYWKTVQQGVTAKGQLASVAALTNATMLYVWSDDESAIKLVGANVSEVTITTNYNGSTPLQTTVQMAAVTIQGGQLTGDFSIKGITKNKSANLVLSNFQGYNWNTTGTMSKITDYRTVPVYCSEPPPPYIDFDTEKSLTATVPVDQALSVAEFDLTLSAAWTGGDGKVYVTVAPVPTVAGLQTNKFIRISDRLNDTTAWDDYKGPVTLEFDTQAVGAVLTKPVYVYALGGNDDTADLDKKRFDMRVIKVEPEGAALYYTKTNHSGRIALDPQLPAINKPVEGASFTDAVRGQALPLEIQVDDNYYNRNDTNTGYTVYWRPNSSTAEAKVGDRWGIQDGILCQMNADGSLDADTLPSITFDESGTFAAGIRIVAPNGEYGPGPRKTDWRTINVTVAEPPPPATATVTIKDTDGEERDTFDEGEDAKVYVTLSKAYNTEDLYVFLKPQETSMYDKVTGRCVLTNATPERYSYGIRIPKGKTSGSGSGAISFADGEYPDTFLTFDVVFYTKNLTPYTGYEGDAPSLIVNNVRPTIDNIYLNGDDGWVEKSGEYWLQTTASIGTDSQFTFDITDPSVVDLNWAGTYPFKIDFKLTGGGVSTNGTLYGNPSETNLLVKFTTADPDVTLKLTAFDKDMQDKTKTSDKGVTKTVHFAVSDKPYVQVVSGTGSNTFAEDKLGLENGKLLVQFYQGNTNAEFTASTGLDVLLTVTNSEMSAKNPGSITLGGVTATTTSNVYRVTVPAGMSYATIYISAADGTENTSLNGFTIIAKVISTSKTSEGTRWCDYFESPDNKTQGTFLIDNKPPTLMVSLAKTTFDSEGKFRGTLGYQNDSTSNFCNGVIGDNAAVTWKVSDITADMGSLASGTNIEVTWSSEGRTVITNVTDKSQQYTFIPKFTTSGIKTITVTATDKDADAGNGTTTASWYYKVASAKQLTTMAHGPSGSGKAKSTRYKGAGLGQGHTWADTTFSTASDFSISWNCALNKTVNCYAWGYKVKGGADNGNLDSGKDVIIDASGDNSTGNPKTPTITDPYDYATKESELDSYFYRWLAVSLPSDDTSSSSSSSSDDEEDDTFAGFSPETPESTSRLSLTLPSAEDSEGGYGETIVEAVFAKEYLASDNMGDINHDGIPDVYVQAYYFDIVDSNSGAITGNDMEELDAYNADLDADGNSAPDFFPIIDTAGYAGFIPALSNLQEFTEGRAFTARTEIRGWDDHFNDAVRQPYSKVSTKIASDICYQDPDNCTTSTLSRLEWWAFTNYCNRAGLDPSKPDNWSKWSPERPTDPTKYDTDGDKISDGFEYYIWYRAHVGYEDTDGTYAQITGRKYNPIHPLEPTVLTAEEVATTYDPLVAPQGSDYATLDTDNDGLPDYVEFLIGTSPFDYDTDNDGLPDGYEVYISESNPQKYATDGTTCDAELNTDGDAMAFYQYVNMGLFGDFRYYVIPATTDAGDLVYICSPTNLTVTGGHIDPVTEGNVYTAFLYNKGTDATPREFCRGHILYSPESYTALNVLTNEASREVMNLAHYQLYQEFPFEPRTAWNVPLYYVGHVVNTRNFMHLDEFLLQAFYYHMNGLSSGELVASVAGDTWATLWAKHTTSPLKADTDDDGMPDGWELYVQAGAAPAKPETPSAASDAALLEQNAPSFYYSPLEDFAKIAGSVAADNDGDGLNWPKEFSGIESSAEYTNVCTTIVVQQPEWKNKWWPTDPWNQDTDGDGLTDGSEGGTFIYGNNTTYPGNEACIAGGGLNPLSWDTDQDGLPDPWEAEFAGTATVAADTTTTSVSGDATNTTVTAGTVTWNNDGMDGTVNDAKKDYDFDGLANWQEYMVGAMRCWRYDDTLAQWQIHNTANLPGLDDEAEWYALLFDIESPNYNPGLVNARSPLGIYFSCATNAFEQGAWSDPPSVYSHFYMFKDGIYHDLQLLNDPESGNRFTRNCRPAASDDDYMTTRQDGKGIWPQKYICCSPILHDTDYDGMDDYYELFHGLNPLLGASKVRKQGVDTPRDVIYEAYYDGAQQPRPWSAEQNNWIEAGQVMVQPRPEVELRNAGGAAECIWDFFQFPWLAGLAMADADGDNIRNQSEAILANLQAAATYLHTDPSALWMTDSSYEDSLTARFYQIHDPDRAITHDDSEQIKIPDVILGHPLSDLPWFEATLGGYINHYDTLFDFWEVDDTIFDYEENEGYDSDHDFLSDFEEGQGKTKNASDPQNHDDPLRRQAMWFGGDDDKGFLQTPTRVFNQVPYTRSASEARQDLLYFTVECWAKPDTAILGDEQLRTLVERAVWTGAANAADEKYLRKNFLIGLKGGRWYAKFDSNGTDKKQPVEITEGPQATNNWTHVAVTYDGTALKLFVDGVCRVNKSTSIRPENGISAISVDEAAQINAAGGTQYWNRKKVSILVGASAISYNGITFDNAWRTRTQLSSGAYRLGKQTTLDDYGNFFKGYIDEVRIWDGARTASDIMSDVENRVRYTAALASENQQAVYASWKTGNRRDGTTSADLPAELRYHWAFDHVAGAVNRADVIPVPAGFDTAEKVTDAMAIWSRPKDWVDPWLDSLDTSLKSKTYTDASWITWVNDTVGHLPYLDQTTVDSVYWSANYAGATAAAESGNGYLSFKFPRTCELPSRYRQMGYTKAEGGEGDPYTGDTRWLMIEALSNATEVSSLKSLYRFTHRNRLNEGHDLIVLGGAFPKRIGITEGGLWDTKPGEVAQAADAWAETGKDSDNNGLPDWWEKYARANYCKGLSPRAALEWDTTVNYHGVSMPAWRAYLNDLAKGLVKDGSKVYFDEANYADNRDADKDGLPDSWEELWKLDTTIDNADDDPDNDGLSNYQEYLLSKIYPDEEKGFDLVHEPSVTVPDLNPTLDHTYLGQTVPDYFLKYSDVAKEIKTGSTSHFFLNEYFGEVVTDHDFMEDWWENLYDYSYTSAKTYDPLQDAEGDGWSTWTECRASLWGNSFTADLISKWTGLDSSQYVVCRPQPIVGVRVTSFKGASVQDLSGQQLVVRVTSGQSERTDATFVVPPALDGQTKFIGGFDGDSVLHGHLSPGMLNVNSIVFDRSAVTSDKVYIWNCDWYKENEPNDLGWTPSGDYRGWLVWSECVRTHTGTFEEYKSELETYPKIELEGGDFNWESFVQTIPSTDLSSATLTIDGVTKFGWIDCTTGEYELDMSKFSGDGSVSEYVFRVTYTSRLGHEWPQTVYLSDTKELETTGIVGIGEGYVREGRNTIEAFMDLNANGEFDVGEPFGSARNVMIGWHKVPVVTIELHDTSPIMPCVAVAKTASPVSSNALQKTVRITRRFINGINENEGKHLTERQLVTKNVVLDDHPYLTEADVVNVAKPDLDWNWLVKDAKKFGIEKIESVTYSVDEIDTLLDGSTTNITLSTFVKQFSTARTVASAVSPVEMAPVYASSPTFTFAASDEKATGYRLQIQDTKSGQLIYDSGARLLPGRTSGTVGQYVYAVTPPVFAGMEVYAGVAPGALFADGSNYQWRVALVNAKFNSVEETDYSAWADFQMDLTNANRYPKMPTGYGNVELAVRYYGPTNVAPTNIIVEAFENADFSGQPLAQTRLAGTIELLSSQEDVATVNATLRGVSPGTRFFRAYFDQNNNGIRDRWESWGYVNHVGKSVKAIYNPKEVTVSASAAVWDSTGKTDVIIYMEDCDVNQNEYPDCIDAAGDWLAAANADTPYWEEPDNTTTTTSDPMTDTDGDGMPDVWETWNDGITDPLVADGETLPVDQMDAMAYLEETWQMVTIDDGSTDGLRYLADGTIDTRAGLTASNYVFSTYYLYGNATTNGQVYGVGTNVVITNAWPIKTVGPVTVALVHAQVYARQGFNTLTANAAALENGTAVDTKAFTALDRYLVMRYFEAIGVAEIPAAQRAKYKSFEEYAMNAGSDVWKQWTLMPGTVDANNDFVADGWQLYVMYGTNLTVGARMAANDRGKTSPWGSITATTAAVPDGSGLSWRQEYNLGIDPSNPWNQYSLYESLLAQGLLLDGTARFSDQEAKNRFSIDLSDTTTDSDLDQISDINEWQAYYYDPKTLTNLSATCAWSDGTTPDYFRTCGSSYLGLLFNGGEFIHSKIRDDLGMIGLEKAGTRDYDNSGWDYWSVAQYSLNSEYVGITDTDLTFVLKYLDAVVPGECSAKTLSELRDFVRTTWAGQTREVRSGDYWDDDYNYSYSYTYDEATGAYVYTQTTESTDDDSITWLTLTGDQLVTLDEMIKFFGGRTAMQKTIAENMAEDDAEEILTPEPVINLTVRYAGDTKKVMLVEAYQVNSAYSEYGEQMTAFWNTSAEFNSGVAKVTLGTANSGSLKQGPARFVAYIDVDGDGKLSSGDTYGEATATIGYIGCDLAIRLGDANTTGLPVISLAQAGSSNEVSTIALVRSAVNGKAFYNNGVKVVYQCTRENNASREVLTPAEFITSEYIGIDRYFSSEYDESQLANIESVTYEVLRLNKADVESVSVTNLNHYFIITETETNGVTYVTTNVCDSTVNEEITFNYSRTRDEAASFAFAGSTEDDWAFSFSVPTDGKVNTKFWLMINGTVLGGDSDANPGYPLTGLAGGRKIIDSQWFKDNKIADSVIVAESNNVFRVLLGNDKFGYSKSELEKAAFAEFYVAKKATYTARLAVRVLHPTTNFDDRITIAAYATSDLANPVATKTGCATSNLIELTGLRPGKSYYLAAWYVKNASDGRSGSTTADATIRMPYDTWGYLTALGESANGFDAIAVTAKNSITATNIVYLQHTDWNDNGIDDFKEDIKSIGTGYSTELTIDHTQIIPEGANNIIVSTGRIYNDVMAYAEITCPCVGTIIGNQTIWYAVDDMGSESSSNRLSRIIPVGTPLKDLKTLRATYYYDFGAKNPKTLALGTNVNFAASNLKVTEYATNVLAIVHAQVYAQFGFHPQTANAALSNTDWVNTKRFNSTDRGYVTNYFANVCGLTNAPAFSLAGRDTDADAVAGGRGDGIPDGWELYVMFGTNKITTLTANDLTNGTAKIHSPWNYADRTSDLDHDGCDQLHEYDNGDEPTDPWNAYSMYENFVKAGLILEGTSRFNDSIARYFGVTIATKNNDDDQDLITNIDEMRAYFRAPTALTDLSVATAWSDGTTPDYFRTCGSTYLGALFNGGEFIEPEMRSSLGMGALANAGTRDLFNTGWDVWSIIRNAQGGGNDSDSHAIRVSYLLKYMAIRYGAKFTGTTEDEAIAFHNENVPHTTVATAGMTMTIPCESAEECIKHHAGLIDEAAYDNIDLAVETLRKAIVASGADVLESSGMAAPQPSATVCLKYAGNEKLTVIVEVYQSSSEYAEFGERMAAKWTKTDVQFDAGIATVALECPADAGSLKQGPARFVAYIDVDGDGQYSAADTYGTATATIGYLGADVTIALGEANPQAYPMITLTSGSNTVSTIALVRSAINGQYLYNDAKGVFIVQFPNNAGREALCPQDYVMSGHVGIDKGLSQLANVKEITSVTYEVLYLTPDQVTTLSVTNLNHYVIVSNNVSTACDQTLNEEITISYSPERDVAQSIAVVDNTADDIKLSFSVPTDVAVSRFWLSVTNETTGAARVYGDDNGFILTGIRDGVVVLDSDWMADNAVSITTGKVHFAVALGNDKYGKPTDWTGVPEATCYVNVARVYDGAIAVKVAHALEGVTFDTGVTVAAYDQADLANPVAYTNGNATGVITLTGLRAGVDYYVAAWYVKDSGDGRSAAAERRPYDTWGYLCNLMVTNTTGIAVSPAFDAVTAEAKKVVSVTNAVYLQDTDWNDNGIADREEYFSSKDGTYTKSVTPTYGFSISGLTSELFSDADEGDVMAYALVSYPCVATTNALGELVWYVVTDLAKETTSNKTTTGISKGTPLSELKTLYATYWYDAGANDPTQLALGRATTIIGDAKVMQVATKEIVLVHAQVYEKYGFNMNTANGAISKSAWVNTKAFNSTDKAYIVNYLKNVLGLSEAEAKTFSLIDAKNNTYPDADYVAGGRGDGIADGWELYVMFGADGVRTVTAAELKGGAKIHSPWNYADRAADLDGDGLDQLHEYDGGYYPTNPWAADTDSDNVSDLYAYRYHLKGGDAGKDFDGDGLSNYAEYLISRVFRFKECDPDQYATSDGVCDYYAKVGELYLGEMFTDHDQVDDLWEQGYEKQANRYVYDPTRDDDGDGWSNYAEAKAGTSPAASVSVGVDGETLAEYPIPTIAATVKYAGKQTLSGSIYFQAWGTTDTGMTGEPDAIWCASEAAGTNATKYIGQNPGTTVTYSLGTGVITPGSLKLYFLDSEFERVALESDGTERYSFSGEVGDAQWYNYVQDYNGVLKTSAVTNGVLETSQVAVGTVDYTTGKVTIDFANPALQQALYQRGVNGSTDSATDYDTNAAGLYYSHEKLDLSRSYVKLAWKPAKIATTGNTTYYLSDATGGKGHIREGKNKFTVFCDLNGDGAYTAGEPFGFVRDVNVGWDGASFTVALTETSPIFARIDLRAEDMSTASDRQVWQEGLAGVVDMSITENDGLAESLGLNYKDGDEILDLSSTRLTRIRILRVAVNGSPSLGLDDWDQEINCKQVVLDKYLDLGTRSYLHEGDFLTDGAYDVDWATMPTLLNKKARPDEDTFEYSYVDPTNVTYAIVVGEGDIENSTSNLAFRCLVNRVFDWRGARVESPSGDNTIRPVIGNTTPQNLVYGARPTFRFAMKDGLGNFYNNYTCFKIKIGSTEIGPIDLPPRDADGWYTWTLDEALGAKLPASGNYSWQVALYNAKYQSGTCQGYTLTEWSEKGTFTVDINNQQPMNDHGYSSIVATVKYAGPSEVLKKGHVIVQAFETADFAGSPVGQDLVTADVAATASDVSIVANAVVKGLPQTGTYYLRAFIDTDGDYEKDDWESWGAGDKPVTLSTAVVTLPTVGIWIEDADTDGDWYPDAYEMVKKGNLTTLEGTIVGDDTILFSTTATGYAATSDAGISTGLSGASLTAFQNSSIVNTLLGNALDTEVSIADIRAAVEKRVQPNTVKITALTIANSKVTLSVAAEVAPSIAGTVLGELYKITSGDTAQVTVKVYRKATLAEAWPTTPTYTATAYVGREDAEIDVPIAGIDLSSGFYKVDVVQ